MDPIFNIGEKETTNLSRYRYHFISPVYPAENLKKMWIWLHKMVKQRQRKPPHVLKNPTIAHFTNSVYTYIKRSTILLWLTKLQ